jgi:hypothetical protein
MSQHDDGFGGNPRAPMTESGPDWKEPTGNLGRALQTERKGPDFAAKFGCVCDGAGECFACFARAEGSAAAPAERADLLKRLHGIADGIRLYGTPDHELAADRIDAIGVALAQPVSPAPTQRDLRKLVDHVWQTCAEDESVPSTEHADRMIAAALGPVSPAPPKPFAYCVQGSLQWKAEYPDAPYVIKLYEGPVSPAPEPLTAQAALQAKLATLDFYLTDHAAELRDGWKPLIEACFAALASQPVAAPEALTAELHEFADFVLIHNKGQAVPWPIAEMFVRRALASQPVAVEREES